MVLKNLKKKNKQKQKQKQTLRQKLIFHHHK